MKLELQQSLNSNLLTGPDLLNSLLGVLMRFRENQIAVLADIEGMFMQIAINQTDQSALRFLWINDDEIQQYQFTRLIFGATCSPSCAIYVLNHCVDKNGDKFPEAVRAVKSHFYMDDYIQSHDTVTNATETVQQTIQSLQGGGFRLTKFVSNEPDVLKNIPTHDIEEKSEIVRVLGQKWNLKSDTLIMKPLTDFSTDAIEYTQKKIFSLVCSIFDPLGILSPLTIRFKILLQEIWKLGKKWDEPLPIQIRRRLQKILDSYFEMPEVHLTRTLTSLRYSESSAELHIFVDASTAAMAAVAYLRITHNHSEITETCFLIGKCKVAPLKQTSVPKLELEAAVIGVRLHSTIVKESSFAINKTQFWTDSQVVPDWIASSKKQPVYIANRLREIAASTKTKQWRHISTLNNPADHGTRGLDPREISLKWLQPPEFLSSSEQISNQAVSSKPAVVATTAHTASNVAEPIIDTARFSSWTKMLLTLATVFNLLFRAKKLRDSKEQYTTDDIDLSRKHLIRNSQENSFHTAVSSLKRGLKPHSKCKLRSLNPILDQNGILRSCGRLQFAPDSLEIEKCPIILHAKDTITRLYLEHAHRICIHQGTEPVKAFVQQRYHVFGLRKCLLSIKFRCFLCRRFNAENIQPIMAPLPAFRFPSAATQFPFSNSGVDFFGPFYIEDTKGNLEKHYGLIFTCLITRAVHLESCPDLNTGTFLNAFRRFTSRQCQPELLYSDNGKTFIGASEELKKSVKSLDNDKIYKALAATNTIWRFNPTYGPHFGGVWERLIQTAKKTLLIILGSKRLSLDVFQTILAESEAIMNSRPLTNVADLPDNEMPLTPNHFLISRPFNSLPPGKFDSQTPASFRTWRNLQQMMNHFWKRLVKEYLPTLLKRSKWNENNQSPLKVNDVVWILKDMTLRGIWPLGRVLEVYPGRDGQHRVVKVKTAYGTFVRPVSAFARVLAD